MADNRYYGDNNRDGGHVLKHRWSYIPLQATFRVGRRAFKEALVDAWKIDYQGGGTGVTLVALHSKFGKVRFSLSATEAESGVALMARNLQGGILRLAIAHGVESLREVVENAPGMPWPAQDGNY